MLTRKLAAVALLAGASVVVSSAQPAQQPTPKRTLVRAGHLLDVKAGKLLDSQTIVVVGDTIQAISPTADVQAQPGDTLVDLSGMTVLPGLIDMHTHLTMNPDFDP